MIISRHLAKPRADPLALRRHSALQTPREGTVAFVECRDRLGMSEFRGGQWRGGDGLPLGFEPTHWTAAEGSHAGATLPIEDRETGSS